MSDLSQYSRRAGPERATRSIALPVVLDALFGGVPALIGWVFFGMGMLGVWAVVLSKDTSSWHFLGPDSARAVGTVTGVTETGWSEGGDDDTPGTPIYRINYQFEVNSRTFTGASFETGLTHSVGQPVNIEYSPDEPEISLIHGLRTDPVGPFVLFVLFFPVVGGIIAGVRFRRGLRTLAVLRAGKVACGRLLEKHPTNTSINNQTVYRLVCEFSDESGNTHRAEARTHETARLEDEHEEMLLYHPEHPEQARLLDELPCCPRLEGDGRLVATKPGRGWVAVVPPLIALGFQPLLVWAIW
ncbi:MAG: hypothetical protein IT463_14270 [Planctomycetes bacterium]|nr:hypothetical protein [Planctomycetota bacterium]